MLIAPQPRGTDKHGSGAFGASRGNRSHNGIDLAAPPGAVCLAGVNGTVTKIGFPYWIPSPKTKRDILKSELRYVQVTTMNCVDHRYFYMKPLVKKGDAVSKNQVIGLAQDLTEIYGEGMTNHIHYECIMWIDGKKNYINPEPLLEEHIL